MSVVRRIERRQVLEDLDRAEQVAGATVDAAQVVKHAGQNLMLGRRRDRCVVEARVAAREPRMQRLETGAVELGAAGERIEDERDRAPVDADQEVAGEADAARGHAHPARDLDVKHRQRDRDADAAIEAPPRGSCCVDRSSRPRWRGNPALRTASSPGHARRPTADRSPPDAVASMAAAA
jgi:hypothetical protein